MYKTVAEAVAMVEKLMPLVREVAHCDIAVIPPFTALAAVGKALSGTNVRMGAQNCHWEKEGAYTGEISPAMLVDVGCRYVTIGHSERRQYFNESDDLLNQRLRGALAFNLTPIFCIGELLADREAGGFQDVVRLQLQNGLSGLTVDQISHIIIAYEPVWAIGTGRTATPEIAQEAHQFIRSFVSQNYGWDCASNLILLYGGSVKPENVSGLMAQPDIDGGLVGGASLDAVSFSKIVKY
jgi:triosephosphate isomerase